MSNDKPVPPTSAPKNFDEDRANAIEERIERLRRMHGWSSETRTLSAQEVEAAAAKAGGGERPAGAGGPAKLFLSYSLAGAPEQKVEVDDEHFDIGAGEKCRLRILHPSLAARHSRISRDGESFRVRDMNTQTGTFVNERRIPLSAQLFDGDKLRCGDVELVVSLQGGAARPTTGQTARPAGPSTAPAARPVAVPPAPAPPPPRAAAVSEGTVSVSRDVLEERIAQLRARVEAGLLKPPGPAPAAPEEEVEELAEEEAEAPGEEEAELAAAAAACFLVYTDSDGTALEVELTRDTPLVVGRRATADVRIVDNSISGAHASFEWVGDAVLVKDLGSTNGTWLEGERIASTTLGDGGVVRLGIVPVEVRFVADEVVEVVEEAELEEPAAFDFGEDEADDAAAPALVPDAGNPVSWHLLWVGENEAVAVLDMDARNACVVAGEGSCEIRVRGRGMKGEHLQFDFTADGGLEVLQARRDAVLKVDGQPVASTLLQGSEVIEAAGLTIRLVRGPAAAALEQGGGHSKAHRFWAERMKHGAQEVELRFSDSDSGAELTLYGDCGTQLVRRGGARPERRMGAIEPALQRLLMAALSRAGFPDQPQATRDAGGPELRALSGEAHSQVVLSDELVAASSAWREARDLLRALAAVIV